MDEVAEEITFLLEAETNGWLGLSVQARPGRMFPADAVIAQPGSGSPTTPPTIKSYKFTSYEVTGAANADEAQSIFNASLTSNGTFSRLQFSRKLDNGGEYPISLSQANHLGWAYSPFASLGHHTARGALSLTFAGSKSGKIGSVKHPKEKDYLIHGYLNVLAWCFLIPMSVLAMMLVRSKHHLFRSTSEAADGARSRVASTSTSTSNITSEEEAKAKKKAVRTHLLANVAAVTLSSAAVLHAILHFHDKVGIRSNSHALLGITAVSLAILSVTGGILRPAAAHSARRVWSFVHKNGGRVVAVASLTNVFLGLEKYAEMMKGYQKQPFFKSQQGLLTIALILIVAAVPSATALAKAFIKGKKTKVECSGVELTAK
jgi:hypothetical protein